MNRNVIIALGVVAFHAGALWALQNGLLQRAIELVVPAEILIEFIEPSAPKAAPPSPKVAPLVPPPKATPVPVAQAVAKAPAPAPVAAAQPLAIADTTPSPNAPSGVTEVAAAVAPTTPVAPSAVAPATPAPARVELPSSDADYLQNPKPPYPGISRRLNEQGKVVVRVFIGVEGTAQKAEIKKSSGFDRLDQAALATVLRWRYVPGKRGGVPEAMWFNVPISFELE
jgi:protein TonB